MTDSRLSNTKSSTASLGPPGTAGQGLVLRKRVVNGRLELSIDGGSPITVGRFAPVAKGDVLTQGGESLFVQLNRTNTRVPLTPSWQTSATLQLTPRLAVIVKEIETDDELAGYQRLTEYHYRGNGGVGRRVPLIACVDCWELPSVVGFIELASSFLVNTARARVLDTRFSDPSRGVAWTQWKTKSNNIASINPIIPQNSIVRISRCVVFPELRGVGLAKVLVDASILYSQQRWHVGGVQPVSYTHLTLPTKRIV